MIIAIDMGNTNIVIGVINNNKTYFVERLYTDHTKTALEYTICFKNILEHYQIDPDAVEGSIISSVVPPLCSTIKKALETITKKPTLVVGPGMKTGLNIIMDNPGSLGSDLVVDAVAAINEYPAPIIIIDMGTATTMSVIDKKLNYIGGVIIPGLKVSLDSLSGQSSQLPHISLESPKRTIGKNTIDCMKSGIINGNASMLDGMIDRMETELGESTTVIATGGLAQFIVPHCNHKIIYDDTLLLKGLLIIYNKNN